MEQTKGKIQEIEPHESGRKRIKLDIWYSYFGNVELKKGDYVEAQWEPEGKFKTIKEIEVKPEPEGYVDKEELIIRQACIKAAGSALDVQVPFGINPESARGIAKMISLVADGLVEYVKTGEVK